MLIKIASEAWKEGIVLSCGGLSLAAATRACNAIMEMIYIYINIYDIYRCIHTYKYAKGLRLRSTAGRKATAQTMNT